MTCARCGSWQSAANVGNRFCSNCGATLAGTPSQPGYDQPGYGQPAYDQPGYGQPAYEQPTYVQPAYPEPGYPAAGPGPAPVAPRPSPAPARATDRDWMRHPGTWVIAATVLLVAGIVLAAVIVSSGGSDDGNRAAAPASTSASSSAPATTSAAAPSTATQTVIVVPAAPGTPAETRTVTVAPEQPTGTGSGPFAGATEVDAAYYQSGSTVAFDSPSHNIGCRLVYGGGEAQCTIKDYDFSEPGHDCDIGAGVLMDAGSSPSIDCISNPAYSGATILAYGESVTFGGFSCVSRASGVTCVDGNSSGFTLSREVYTAY